MDNEQLLDRVQNLLLGLEERMDGKLQSMEERINGKLQTVDRKVDSVRAELKLNNDLLAPFIT